MILKTGLACGRRVEVLLLHQAGSEPSGTLEWLKPRPLLARHHHVRLSHNKVRSMHFAHAPFSWPHRCHKTFPVLAEKPDSYH